MYLYSQVPMFLLFNEVPVQMSVRLTVDRSSVFVYVNVNQTHNRWVRQ